MPEHFFVLLAVKDQSPLTLKFIESVLTKYCYRYGNVLEQLQKQFHQKLLIQSIMTGIVLGLAMVFVDSSYWYGITSYWYFNFLISQGLAVG